MDERRVDVTSRLLVLLAQAWHGAGAPSNLIEDSVRTVAATFKIQLQINALPTSLMLAVGPPFAQRVVMLRLEPGALNLARLATLDSLANAVGAGLLSADAGVEALETLAMEKPRHRPFRSVVAYALLSGGMATLLGGGWTELLVSIAIGMTTGVVAEWGEHNIRVRRLFEVIAAFLAAIIVGVAHLALGPFAVYIAIIAGIVQLLPGYSLTQALYEIANRNLMAGSALLAQVLLVLLSLTCGAALGIAIVGSRAFSDTVQPAHPIPIIFFLIAIPSIAFAELVHLRARSRDYAVILLSCTVAILASHGLALIASTQVVAFGSSLLVGIVANLGAQSLRVSSALLLIPGTVMLVPGALGYQGFLYVFQSEAGDGVVFALRALISAILIVAGLLFAQLVFSGTPKPLALAED